LRLIHINNLHIYLRRQVMHSPNTQPNDGLVWNTNHNASIQSVRHIQQIPCGPGGTVHDYVPFYFGYLSPMLLNLHTGRVDGYKGDQTSFIYLVCHAQDIFRQNLPFAFSDGHGIAQWTDWFDRPGDLVQVDWNMVKEKWWSAKKDPQDPDRQRRKQAEFLVHSACPWALVREIVVINTTMQTAVQAALAKHNCPHRPPVVVRPSWYY